MRDRLRDAARVLALGLAALLPMLAVRPACAVDPQAASLVERGRYLAAAGDCAACHTRPDGKPFAGGLPIETPFGTLVSANITPDRRAGIGAWSDEDFVRSMQEGLAPGGEHLYPAMPYPYFTRVTRADLLAIRAWLATLEPVGDAVETNRLPFPFRLRSSMVFWNGINFTKGEYQSDPGHSAEWNRGAYLVNGLGHCAACHTPKNLMGGDRSGQPLAGGVLQGQYATPLDGDVRTGLGAWQVADIVSYLKTGWGAGQAASGSMALVVADSTSQLADSDLHAIAVYLKDLAAPARSATPLSRDSEVMKTGRALYGANCAACHTASGAGVAGIAPTLAGSAIVQAAAADSLIDVVLNGAQAVATEAAPTAPGMPAFGWLLSDDQIAALLSYVRNDWGNAAGAVQAGDVAALRGQRHDP
jgi:mono/diheme cytochrome c family protein